MSSELEGWNEGRRELINVRRVAAAAQQLCWALALLAGSSRWQVSILGMKNNS